MLGRFRVTSFILGERRDTVYDGSQRMDNPLQERTSIAVPILMVDYRFANRAGVQASTAVPLIARTGVVPGARGEVPFKDEVRGLGDSIIGAWYRGGSPLRWTWIINGGVSIPTGATRTPRFRDELEAGSLVPKSRLQRGSGTWDPVLGLSVERGVAGGRWVTSIAARTPVAENRDGLRTGVSSELGTGWAHTVGAHKLMAYGRVDWLHRRQDTFLGTPVLVGGGHWIYLTPGVAVMVGRGINVQADVKLPIYRNLANRQLDSSVIWQLGVSRSF
jgi:hypothetical protein